MTAVHQNNRERKSLLCRAVGKRISARRKLMKMSQADLARVVGCFQNNVFSWESTETPVPIYHMKGVCDALEMHVDELLWGEPQQVYVEQPFPKHIRHLMRQIMAMNIVRQRRLFLMMLRAINEKGGDVAIEAIEHNDHFLG